MPDRFLTDTIDAELAPGARNAIRVCLRLQPNERITIITDEATAEIAAALQAEVEEVGAPHAVFVLENYAERPLTRMPKIILDDLAQSQVSIFAATTLTGELGPRIEMTAVINKNRIRHGHMVNINRQMMLEGMRADFYKVDRLSQKVIDIVRNAKEVRATTAGGSAFTAALNPNSMITGIGPVAFAGVERVRSISTLIAG